MKKRRALKIINKRKNEKGTKTKTRTGARAGRYAKRRGAVTVVTGLNTPVILLLQLL